MQRATEPSRSLPSSIAPAAAASTATPASNSISTASTRVSSMVSRGPLPSRQSRISRTSSALPCASPSGWSMSVRSAVTRTPALVPTSKIDCRRRSASASVCMNAARPVFTSITRPSRFSASFFARIELVINGTLSTVPVTSRVAYMRRSAGATSALADAIA